MAYIGNFNAADIEPVDFSALPAGEYIALISGSEFRPTKSGNGQYLALTHQIIDGHHKGRLLWHNLNLINSNEKAVEIAQRELSAICRATGAMQIDNSELLHDKPMKITVTYKPAGNDKNGVYREEENRIKKWESLTTATDAATTASPRPAPAPTAPRSGTPNTAAPTPRRQAPPPAAPAAVAGRPWGPPPATQQAPVAPAPQPELAAATTDNDVPF